MPHYEIILNWSNEDNIFIAKASELSGCMAHGNSQEEALANIQEAISLWIETARKYGGKIPQPKVLFTVCVGGVIGK